MHPNPAFRQTPEERNIAFVRERSFGTLAINAPDGPLLSHIPFRLSEDGKTVELHLVRSNPIVRELDKPKAAVISVLGGDAYISPDWYNVPDQVPTWNYIAVHVRGMLSMLEHDELHGVLDRLSDAMETRLLPKEPWTSAKMDQNIYVRMQRQIVPVRMEVGKISGTWKLSQNKPEQVRMDAATGVEEFPMGSDATHISRLMRDS